MLIIIQIIITIVLSLLVLAQTKATGLSSSVVSSLGLNRTRRGVERMVFFLTIFFSVAFAVNSLLLLFTR